MSVPSRDGERRVLMLVATHKAAQMPADDMYLPVQVGRVLAASGLGLQADDDGDNISSLNRSYCELTAVYWGWKNSSSRAVGLSHYRRYFTGTQEGPNGVGILGLDEAEQLLARTDVVVGKRRNYLVESIETHYRNAHHGEDLDILRAVVSEVSPSDVPAFDTVFRGRTLSLYNMFLMRRDLFDEYADWLFTILFETSARLGDHEARTSYQRRTEGYLGERLLNVWVAARSDLRVERRKIVNVDGEDKAAKALRLLGRKTGLIKAADRVK